MRTETVTCPNSDCNKSFTVPLKTLNVTTESEYLACPFCLTAISPPTTETEEEIETEPKVEVCEVEDIVAEDAPVDEEEDAKEDVASPNTESQVVESSNSTGCSHYMGYLNEKDHKAQIPDECLLCMQISDCMHQKREG